MPTTLITRQEAAQLSGTSPTTVKKAIDQKVVPTKRSRARSMVETDDVPLLAMLGLLSDARLPVKYKRRLRRWLREPGAPNELELMPGLIVRMSNVAQDAGVRAERYARLRDQWIVRDPGIKGGDPVIRGSRVSVHTLAARIARGESADVLAEDFPHIPAEAREVAVQYARANARRGRPRRAAA